MDERVVLSLKPIFSSWLTGWQVLFRHHANNGLIMILAGGLQVPSSQMREGCFLLLLQI